jgi:DedD protein
VQPSIEKTAENKPSTGAGTPDAPWTVQVGSFSQNDNAEALAAKLRELDYPAYVSRYNDGDRVHYRVRVGGFPSRDAAQNRADAISAKTGEPARPVQSR